MFYTIIILSYTIPGVYLFVRIMNLFIEKKKRMLYVIIFAILYFLYPARNIIENIAPPSIVRFTEALSDYLLPFFLYLFLSVLLIDILLLINLLFRIIPREKSEQRILRTRIFFIVISLSLLIVIAGILNFNSIRISDYHITIPGKSSATGKIRIAFVSDFHLEESVSTRFVEKYVREIKRINPDLLLYGGDILEGDGENIEKFETLLKDIKTEYGVFGVLGNHDRISRFNENFFTRAGIILLRDSAVISGNSIVIAGRNDSRVNTRMSAEELAGNVPDSLPLIVIDHRPEEMEQLSSASADLVFSGHTHNGQLFPLNFIINGMYELSHGYLKKSNTHFFVSSGLRLWGPPVRTIGKSEILVVDVTFN